jgi:hypothetical protein
VVVASRKSSRRQQRPIWLGDCRCRSATTRTSCGYADGLITGADERFSCRFPHEPQNQEANRIRRCAERAVLEERRLQGSEAVGARERARAALGRHEAEGRHAGAPPLHRCLVNVPLEPEPDQAAPGMLAMVDLERIVKRPTRRRKRERFDPEKHLKTPAGRGRALVADRDPSARVRLRELKEMVTKWRDRERSPWRPTVLPSSH